MKARVLNAGRADFKNYGGRGIRACPAWLESFEQFLADVGSRPSSAHSLDRINNDGNYESGNVRWATKAEQAANRRSWTVNLTAGEMRDIMAARSRS
jgi:hypothetical protein